MKKRLFALLLAALMVNAMVIPASASTLEEDVTADALYFLGLFLGTGNSPDGMPNYDLDADLTRSQGVVLLVRMLGKEADALNGNYTHPFKDTAKWYDKHVGYAYANKLTNGTGTTTYSGEQKMNAQMFAAFCLRSLGYNDQGESPEFTWENALDMAKKIGLNIDDTGSFTRAEAVNAFWGTMNLVMNRSEETLAEKLIAEGVFEREDFERATQIAKLEVELSDLAVPRANGLPYTPSGGGGGGTPVTPVEVPVTPAKEPASPAEQNTPVDLPGENMLPEIPA